MSSGSGIRNESGNVLWYAWLIGVLDHLCSAFAHDTTGYYFGPGGHTCLPILTMWSLASRVFGDELGEDTDVMI